MMDEMSEADFELFLRSQLDEMQLLKRDIAKSVANGKPTVYLKYQTGNRRRDIEMSKSHWPTVADILKKGGE